MFSSTIRIDCYAAWPFPVRSWPWPEVKFSKLPFIRSTFSLFDVSRRQKRNAGKRNVETLLSQKWLQENIVRKKAIFRVFCPLKAKPLTWGQIWAQLAETPLKGLSNALFCGAIALLVSELCAAASKTEKCWNRQHFTFADLWWPDIRPDLKNDRFVFVLFLTIFQMPLIACHYAAQEPS